MIMIFPFQNKVFIYRGLEYEQIVAFTQRIQTEFPQAKMLHHNTPPDDTIRSSDGQYIQVNLSWFLLRILKSFFSVFLNFITFTPYDMFCDLFFYTFYSTFTVSNGIQESYNLLSAMLQPSNKVCN